MSKIFKISGYVIDPYEEFDTPYLGAYIRHKLSGHCAFSRHLHIEERDLYGFNRSSPISQENCDLYECEKYFKGDDGWPVVGERTVKVGQKYKHFKGNIVEVIAVSQDTEMPGQYIVVYIDKDNAFWHRPLGMFLSEVDHVKYPKVEQKYRLELLED